MDWAKELEQFIERLKTLKDSVTTEEATKTSLIMPFFSLLGYDVFNPLEFVPEYTADVGIKKGEKVDYAILKDGVPVVLIEAKSVHQKLSKYSSQLFRYFSTTKAKFAILTNGIQYRFYTDLNETNKMDAAPFNQIDLLNLKNSQIDDLLKFHKNSFDVTSILDSASILKYKGDFKEALAEQLENPSDDFVRLFLQDRYQGMKTQAVISKFRPILKQALGEFINEMMNDKIKTALNATTPTIAPPPSPAPPVLESDNQAGLTELEAQAFQKFLSMVSAYVDTSNITCKKTENYVALLYQNNVRKWIARLAFTSGDMVLILPDVNKQEIRCRISNLYEMENYRPYIISVLARYTDLLQPFDLKNVKVYTIDIVRRFPKRKKNSMRMSGPELIPAAI